MESSSPSGSKQLNSLKKLGRSPVRKWKLGSLYADVYFSVGSGFPPSCLCLDCLPSFPWTFPLSVFPHVSLKRGTGPWWLSRSQDWSPAPQNRAQQHFHTVMDGLQQKSQLAVTSWQAPHRNSQRVTFPLVFVPAVTPKFISHVWVLARCVHEGQRNLFLHPCRVPSVLLWEGSSRSPCYESMCSTTPDRTLVQNQFKYKVAADAKEKDLFFLYRGALKLIQTTFQYWRHH